MINLALVALLSGSLLLGSPDGEKPDGTKKDATTTEQAATESAASQSIVVIGNDDEMPSDEEDITNDTFALGRSADEAPVKLWVSYAYGVVSEVYNENGDDGDYEANGFVPGEITSQRIIVGGQINLINFPRFKFGGGAQLVIGQNVFDVSQGSGTFPVLGTFDVNGAPTPVGGLGDAPFSSTETAFGLQSLKVYGMLQGKTLGLHGGYIFDLGEDREFTTFTVDNVNGTNLATGAPVAVGTVNNFQSRENFNATDLQDAIFFGADFDYPTEWIRLFGGIDYFLLLEGEEEELISTLDPTTGQRPVETVTLDGINDLIVMKAGIGFRVSFFEIGAAAQIRSQIDATFVSDGFESASGVPASGGHQGSILPYLIIRPPNFPAALSIKGGVLNEYADYGLSLGGANEFKTNQGITATLSVGFN
ncbi:MAG: hypothetical protein AAF624_02270 [Bacteroidota bacterium]